MKPARHLVMAENPGDTFIYRYADDWSFSGDTWHQNTQDALAQIEYEFGVSNLEWKIVSEHEATVLMAQGKRK